MLWLLFMIKGKHFGFFSAADLNKTKFFVLLHLFMVFSHDLLFWVIPSPSVSRVL